MDSPALPGPLATTSSAGGAKIMATATAHRGMPSAPPEPAPARPVARWVDHFRSNQTRQRRIPWDSPHSLSADEIRRIARSIAGFQRGESSEAVHYLRKSSLFSLASRDAAFHEASVLFVREENEHAALLLRFMNGAGIPPLPVVFSDGIFRRVRAFSDLAWTSRVLLVAELVAQEYYPCLSSATAHPVLRRICAKLIRDESAHIRFQVERIAHLEARISPRRRRGREWLQGALLTGAALVVYPTHRRVLSRLGFVAFTRRLLRRFRRANRAIRALEHTPM